MRHTGSDAEYRERHPGLRAEQARERYQRGTDIIREAKATPCMDCGNSYPYYVMDFDHRNPAEKSFQVGGSGCQRAVATLLSEIAKCDVVCANCHRERTHKERAAKLKAARRRMERQARRRNRRK